MLVSTSILKCAKLTSRFTSLPIEESVRDEICVLKPHSFQVTGYCLTQSRWTIPCSLSRGTKKGSSCSSAETLCLCGRTLPRRASRLFFLPTQTLPGRGVRGCGVRAGDVRWLSRLCISVSHRMVQCLPLLAKTITLSRFGTSPRLVCTCVVYIIHMY